MPTIRNVAKIIKNTPVLEGAGVHLKRVFGFGDTALYDPFLLFDDFRSDTPEHFLKGFPWHPHRGIETITYVLTGDVEHGDSLGNKGTISSGDVQWMTAGSGIIHQEMPKGDSQGRMYGFQLWANLPSQDKMMIPRYRDISASQIPEVTLATGVKIKVIAGDVLGVRGPVQDIVIDPEYIDVTIEPNSQFTHPTKGDHTVIAYVFEGQGYFSGKREALTGNGAAVLYGKGDEVVVTTGAEVVRFLLISGKPLGEPVAWRGPIVMNTQEELEIAFEEYNQGTFIRHNVL